MELALVEAKRAGDRGDYPIGAVITRVVGKRELVIASAGNRVKTSGSSIKHVELETLKYVSSGYGRYLPDFRAVFHSRTVRDVRRRVRLGQDRCRGVRSFSRRHRRIRKQARERILQMARVPDCLSIRV
jgi:hypothetical protein